MLPPETPSKSRVSGSPWICGRRAPSLAWVHDLHDEGEWARSRRAVLLLRRGGSQRGETSGGTGRRALVSVSALGRRRALKQTRTARCHIPTRASAARAPAGDHNWQPSQPSAGADESEETHAPAAGTSAGGTQCGTLARGRRTRRRRRARRRRSSPSSAGRWRGRRASEGAGHGDACAGSELELLDGAGRVSKRSCKLQAAASSNNERQAYALRACVWRWAERAGRPERGARFVDTQRTLTLSLR